MTHQTRASRFNPAVRLHDSSQSAILRHASRATFETMEQRRLLSAAALDVAADLTAGVQDTPLVWPARVDAGRDGQQAEDPAISPSANWVELGDRLGVSQAIAASWSRAADLGQYSLQTLAATTDWAFSFRFGGDLSTLGTRLNATVSESGLIDRVYVATFADGSAAAGALQDAGIVDFYPLVERELTPRYLPNDTFFPQQWHLRNTGQTGGLAGADANVHEAWDRFDSDGQRITGAGITIGIVDDGVHHDHPDLSPGYRFDIDQNWNSGNSNDAYYINGNNSHGTSVAGIAAGRGDNGIGVAGAAYDADIVGLRLIAGGVTDADEAQALSWEGQQIDIYNNSWGPFDDGVSFDPAGPLVLAALEQTATQGRDGLGGIHTWAGGNGGTGSNGDDSNRDGYANSRHTIAIGAITDSGVNSPYSEPGANLLAVTPSSGGNAGTTTTSGPSSYRNSFGGTSSAAPLAAGVVGLMLQANPDLTYRDVQHILVETATKNDPGDSRWFVNGAGRDVNDVYGFGLIDAAAAVDAALAWDNVADEASYSSPLLTPNRAIPDGSDTGIVETFDVPADLDVEHVELTVDIDHTYRGDVEITLISPDGTESKLTRFLDDRNDDIANYTLSSVQFWGEASQGTWQVRVADVLGQFTGTLNALSLSVFGTERAIAPTLVNQSFDDELAHTVTLTFDQDVSASLDSGDVQVRNTITGDIFATELLSFTAEADVFAAVFGVSDQAGTLSSPVGGILPTGNYVAEVVGTVESAGGELQAPAPMMFGFLQGDATRDNNVDLADFLVLRSNFNADVAGFSEADFNYDGVVDLQDFLLLRGNFGTSLPSPGSGSLFAGDDGGNDDQRLL